MIFSLFGNGCGSKKSPDFAFIDRYLTIWDQFARGDNGLIPRLNKERPEFERQLAVAFQKGDPRAPSRLVFFAVVQVGGMVPVHSPLGDAFRQRFGDVLPIFSSEAEPAPRYFAGDFYFWWEKHKSEYQSFPLYEEWHQREFARTVAIKLYESIVGSRK